MSVVRMVYVPSAANSSAVWESSASPLPVCDQNNKWSGYLSVTKYVLLHAISPALDNFTLASLPGSVPRPPKIRVRITVIEIRIRNWSAISLKIGYFIGYWLLSHWECKEKLTNQIGFWLAKCWNWSEIGRKMANGRLLFLALLKCSTHYSIIASYIFINQQIRSRMNSCCKRFKYNAYYLDTQSNDKVFITAVSYCE